MKIIKHLVIIQLLLFSSNGLLHAQNEEILSKSNQFDYLIGMNYSPFDKIDGLTKIGGSSQSGLNGLELKSSVYLSGVNEQIITSEHCHWDLEANTKVCEIKDIIVLKGTYSFCEGCLISKNRNKVIRTVHPYGKRTKDGILLAFEKNITTGIFRKVNPSDYEWKSMNISLNRH